MPCRPPPPTKVFRARSTRSATSAGPGETDTVPESMRPASSRSPIRPRMWLACSTMMRWNSRISAGSSAAASSISVVAEPLMAASGSRSSWPTRPRNSVRSRSISSSGARSWTAITTDPMAPSSARIGVALTSARTLRPSGTESTTSSPTIVSPVCSSSATGYSLKLTSLPSERRNDITSRSCSCGRPGGRRLSAIRRASRLTDTARPLAASNTTTPTGEVSTRASRSARARRSSRWVRALTIAAAAWEANSVSTSSSPSVNASPSALSARKKLPTSAPRWRIGVPWKVRENALGGRDAERADIVRQVGEAQRPRQVTEMLEQTGVVGPGVELVLFLRRESREHEVERRARFVDGGDDAPAGAGERPRALHHLVEHGVEVEARVDPEDGRVERGAARAQRLVLAPQLVGLGQGATLPPLRRSDAGANVRPGGPPAPYRFDTVKSNEYTKI